MMSNTTNPPVTPPPSNDSSTDIEYLRAIYRVVEHFALRDQINYYKKCIKRYRRAAEQVNRIRAIAAFTAGMASALAGLIVAAAILPPAASGGVCVVAADGTTPPQCLTAQIAVGILTIIAILAPGAGAAFTTLADLYQWDRQLSIYEAALENLAIADAQSPVEGMDELTYRASLRAFVEGTLLVMSDETAQWGQLIKPPTQLEKFIKEEREKAARLKGDADQLIVQPVVPPSDE